MNTMGNGKAASATRERYRLRRAMLGAAFGEPEDTGSEEPGIDPEQYAELEENAAALQEENARLRDSALRQKAEFDNFRRRTLKEKDQIRDAAREDLLVRLLPVVDNFDRALEAVETATDAGSLRQGVEMVAGQLRRILEGDGLSRIEALNQPFNPEEHEALAVEERADVPENHVAAVMLPGYRFRDRVIRPAMVKVAKLPAPSPEEAPSAGPEAAQD